MGMASLSCSSWAGRPPPTPLAHSYRVSPYRGSPREISLGELERARPRRPYEGTTRGPQSRHARERSPPSSPTQCQDRPLHAQPTHGGLDPRHADLGRLHLACREPRHTTPLAHREPSAQSPVTPSRQGTRTEAHNQKASPPCTSPPSLGPSRPRTWGAGEAANIMRHTSPA